MQKILIIFIASGILLSCGSSSSSEADQDQQIIADIDHLVEDLPDPSAIPFTLKAIGADFVPAMVNSLDNIEKYQGDRDKLAMNMGVYASDVSYLACYNINDRTMEYARACHDIAVTLGDDAIFDEDLMNRIEASLDQEEALAEILRNMIVETSVQLEQDNELSMAALALTGAFIEELYQAVSIIESYHDAGLTADEEKAKIEPLIKLVLDQEKALADLVILLNEIPRDDTIRGLITQLDILDKMYKGELEALSAKMDEDPNYIVTKEEMFGVTLDIERIRQSIVE